MCCSNLIGQNIVVTQYQPIKTWQITTRSSIRMIGYQTYKYQILPRFQDFKISNICITFFFDMPTCVECGAPVTNLYTEYSKGNIRLTPCVNINFFFDHFLSFLNFSKYSY